MATYQYWRLKKRLSLPKSTLKRELANVKGELALTKMERDIMNYPAASCGVSKNTRNEASFGELTLRD